MKIRKATPDEAPYLSDLALRSKAHWPYTREQIDRYRAQLTLSSEQIADGWTFVATESDRVIGFYVLSSESESARLEFLFVEPVHMRRGVGRF